MSSFLFIINQPTYNIILDYIKAITYKNNLTKTNYNLIIVNKNYTPNFKNIIIDINKINPDVIIYFSEGDMKGFDNLTKINILYKHFTDKLFYLNLEQTTRKNILNFIIKINKFFPNINLIDYSSSNILLLNNYINKDIQLIDYPKCEYEIFNYPKIYDIACIKFKNSKSKRRKKIYYDMINAGLNVIDIEGWGKERDNILFRCKILVNIHFHDNYNIFEEIRCNRCIYNNMIVISENCSFSDKIKLQNKIKFCKYDDIINTIKIQLI
jgi:hypothetical protein